MPWGTTRLIGNSFSICLHYAAGEISPQAMSRRWKLAVAMPQWRRKLLSSVSRLSYACLDEFSRTIRRVDRRDTIGPLLARHVDPLLPLGTRSGFLVLYDANYPANGNRLCVRAGHFFATADQFGLAETVWPKARDRTKTHCGGTDWEPVSAY